jgi:hypothetical protein
MAQLRMNGRRKSTLDLFESFRDALQAPHVSVRILPTCFVADDRQPLCEGSSEFRKHFNHPKTFERAMLSRKRLRNGW